MESKSVICYVSAAITGASPEYLKEIGDFKNELRKIANLTVLDFCLPQDETEETKLTPKEVYQKDINEGLAKAHLVVAELSVTSMGVGLEIGLAIGAYRIPVLMYAKKGSIVSRIMKGAPFHHGTVTYMEYENSLTEMLSGIESMVIYLHRKLS